MPLVEAGSITVEILGSTSIINIMLIRSWTRKVQSSGCTTWKRVWRKMHNNLRMTPGSCLACWNFWKPRCKATRLSMGGSSMPVTLSCRTFLILVLLVPGIFGSTRSRTSYISKKQKPSTVRGWRYIIDTLPTRRRYKSGLAANQTTWLSRCVYGGRNNSMPI